MTIPLGPITNFQLLGQARQSRLPERAPEPRGSEKEPTSDGLYLVVLVTRKLQTYRRISFNP